MPTAVLVTKGVIASQLCIFLLLFHSFDSVVLCAEQDVSGAPGGKMFPVWQARFFRCAGKELYFSGVMFQVRRARMMFQVRRVRCFTEVHVARCFRCVGQNVSGAPDKMFQVCQARCFGCAGQDVSGVPVKMFQVYRARCFRLLRTRCFRCAG